MAWCVLLPGPRSAAAETAEALVAAYLFALAPRHGLGSSASMIPSSVARISLGARPARRGGPCHGVRRFLASRSNDARWGRTVFGLFQFAPAPSVARSTLQDRLRTAASTIDCHCLGSRNRDQTETGVEDEKKNAGFKLKHWEIFYFLLKRRIAPASASE